MARTTAAQPIAQPAPTFSLDARVQGGHERDLQRNKAGGYCPRYGCADNPGLQKERLHRCSAESERADLWPMDGGGIPSEAG
jgi:hypothetical protein